MRLPDPRALPHAGISRLSPLLERHSMPILTRSGFLSVCGGERMGISQKIKFPLQRMPCPHNESEADHIRRAD
jgi:hypothetical protein